MWSPQPGPQAEAIAATWCPELGFGGSRGGGKSDYLLADYLQDVPTYAKYWQGVLFRRTYPELQELIKRSFEMYPPTGAQWYEQPKEWRWPNGACLRMRYLEAVRDASRYQGHQYAWIGWDEKTQWPTLEAYFMLLACLRCADADIPTKRVRSSANPGGPGHQAFKAYFIDPAPGGLMPIKDPATGAVRMFIHSRVTDNQILLQRDPGYIERLRRVGSPQLVKMWLEGDWNVVAGAYFPEFGTNHIIKPFKIPEHWIRFRSFDWGSAKPFSCGWWAVADGEFHDFRNGTLIRYREWYGAQSPNVGLKLTVEQVAYGITNKSLGERFAYSVADPAIFKEDGGPSMAETFARHGIIFRPADNSRISGWEEMRGRLVGHDDKPMVYCFDTCTDSIRTIPAAQHDEHKPEDIDSEGEDHCLDDWRYGLLSRPYSRPLPKPPPPIKDFRSLSIDELWKLEERENARRNHRI